MWVNREEKRMVSQTVKKMWFSREEDGDSQIVKKTWFSREEDGDSQTMKKCGLIERRRGW